MSITGVRPPGRSATVAAAALFALVVGGTLTAQTTPSFPSARAAALGGPHVAGADDLGVLFANPAGFRSAGPELSVAEVNVNVGSGLRHWSKLWRLHWKRRLAALLVPCK